MAVLEAASALVESVAVKEPLEPMLAVVEVLPALIVTLPSGTNEFFDLSVPANVIEAVPYTIDCDTVKLLNAGVAGVMFAVVVGCVSV